MTRTKMPTAHTRLVRLLPDAAPPWRTPMPSQRCRRAAPTTAPRHRGDAPPLWRAHFGSLRETSKTRVSVTRCARCAIASVGRSVGRSSPTRAPIERGIGFGHRESEVVAQRLLLAWLLDGPWRRWRHGGLQRGSDGRPRHVVEDGSTWDGSTWESFVSTTNDKELSYATRRPVKFSSNREIVACQNERGLDSRGVPQPIRMRTHAFSTCAGTKWLGATSPRRNRRHTVRPSYAVDRNTSLRPASQSSVTTVLPRDPIVRRPSSVAGSRLSADGRSHAAGRLQSAADETTSGRNRPCVLPAVDSLSAADDDGRISLAGPANSSPDSERSCSGEREYIS